MSAVFSYCNSVGQYSPLAKPVIAEITETTTPEQFEELRSKFPQFQFDHAEGEGKTILHKAAEKGNVQLIEYIVRQAPQLLERGNIDGHTPLWSAVRCQEIVATNVLIELGANVNVIQLTEIFKDKDIALLNNMAFALFSLKGMSNDGILENLLITKQQTEARRKQFVRILVKNGAQLSSENYKPEHIRVSNRQFDERRMDQGRKQTLKVLEDLAYLPKNLSNLVVEYQDNNYDNSSRGIEVGVNSIVEEVRQELAEERRQTVEILDEFMPRVQNNIVADFL